MGPSPGWSPLLMVGSDGVVKRGLDRRGRRAAVSGEWIEAGDYSLQLREVALRDGGTFRCHVRHPRLREEVRLVVAQASLESRQMPVEGERLCLRCQVSEPLQGLGVSWWKGGTVPVGNGHQVYFNDKGWRLCIVSLRREDAGDWACHVEYQGQRAVAPVPLRIYGFTVPEETVQTFYARPGSSARLSLAIAGGLPAEGGWQRGRGSDLGGLGEAGARARTVLGPEGLHLSLAPALASDRGYYTAYLNVSGILVQRAVRLEVIEVTASRSGPIPLGSSLTLNVSSTYPEGLGRAEWEHENASAWTEAEGRDLFRVEGRALYIPRVTLAHAGNWTCNLYRGNTTVGQLGYLLEVTAMDYLGAELPPSTSRRATLAAVLALLLALAALALGLLARKVKARRRRNFPALDVTLETANPTPGKKV